MTEERDFVDKVRKLSAERQAQERAKALAEQQAARAKERQAAEAEAERVRRAHESYDPLVSRLARLAPMVARQAVARGVAYTVTYEPRSRASRWWGRNRRRVNGWTITRMKSESHSEYDSPNSSSSFLHLVLGSDGRLYGYQWYSSMSYSGSYSWKSINPIEFAELVSWALAHNVESKLGEIEPDLMEFAVRNALW